MGCKIDVTHVSVISVGLDIIGSKKTMGIEFWVECDRHFDEHQKLIVCTSKMSISDTAKGAVKMLKAN